MNKPYIKNKGTTTFITSGLDPECPTKDSYNKIDWDVDYNGKVANLELNVNTDGKSKYLNYELTNDDLANILNMPAFKMPLDQRLKVDFPLNNQEFITPPQNVGFEIPLDQRVIMPLPEDEDIDLERNDLDDIFTPEKMLIPNSEDLDILSSNMDSTISPLSSLLPETLTAKPLSMPNSITSELSSIPPTLTSLNTPIPLPVFEHLINPLQVDELPKKRRFTQKRPQTPYRQKTKKRSRPSSLRRKLMTPRPRTMRILLKPKTHSSSSRHRHHHRRHHSVHPDHPNIHNHKKTHRNTSWLQSHPHSSHIYTPTGH